MTKNLRPLHKTLTEQGFTLVRETRHLIYRHTNGGTLVVSASCSDKHAWRAVLMNARHIIQQRQAA